MPVVPSYGNQQVALSTGNAPQVRNAMTPEVLGESARGDAELARGLGSLGNAMAQLEMQTRAKEDEAQTKRAYVEYSTAAMKLESDYKNRKGLDASQETLDNHNKTLAELRKEMTKGMGNADQARMFDLATVSTEATAGAQMYTHRADQMELARVAESQALVGVEASNLVRAAGMRNVPPGTSGLNEYDTLKLKYATAWQDAHRNSGMGAEASKAAFQADMDKMVHTPTVVQMVADGSPDNAQQYLADMTKVGKSGERMMSATTEANLTRYVENANVQTRGYDLSRLALATHGSEAKAISDIRKMADASARGETGISVAVADNAIARIQQQGQQQRTNRAAMDDNIYRNLSQIIDSNPHINIDLIDPTGATGLTQKQHDLMMVGGPNVVNALRQYSWARDVATGSPARFAELVAMSVSDPAKFTGEDLYSNENNLSRKEIAKLNTLRTDAGVKAAVQDSVGAARKGVEENRKSLPSAYQISPKSSPSARAAYDRLLGVVALRVQTQKETLPSGTPLTAEDMRKIVVDSANYTYKTPGFMGLGTKTISTKNADLGHFNQRSIDMVKARMPGVSDEEVLRRLVAANAAGAPGLLNEE